MDYDFMEALEAYTGMSFEPELNFTDEDYTVGNAAIEAIVADTFDTSPYEAALEGNIIEGAKNLKKLLSEVKTHKTAMKDAANAGKYEEAANEADEIARLAGECQRSVDSLPNNLASNLIVNIAILFVLSFVGKLGGKVETKLGHVSKKATKQTQASVGKIGSIMDDMMKAAGATEDDMEGMSFENIMGAASQALDPKAITINHRGSQLKRAGLVGMIINHIRISKAVKNGEMPASEKNTLLVAVRAFANHMKASYTKLATAYRNEAKNPTSDSAIEAFIGASDAGDSCWLFD